MSDTEKKVVTIAKTDDGYIFQVQGDIWTDGDMESPAFNEAGNLLYPNDEDGDAADHTDIIHLHSKCLQMRLMEERQWFNITSAESIRTLDAAYLAQE